MLYTSNEHFLHTYIVNAFFHIYMMVFISKHADRLFELKFGAPDGMNGGYLNFLLIQHHNSKWVHGKYSQYLKMVWIFYI